MSSSKSKSRDEERYESKRHKKYESDKRDNSEDSFEYKCKQKKSEYDKRDKRKIHEDDDNISGFSRRKREKHNEDESITPESEEQFSLNRQKSKKKKYDKNERLDKENDYYITNYDKKEKVNYDKKDGMMSKENEDFDEETKQKKNVERLYPNDNFDDEHSRKIRKKHNEKEKKERIHEARFRHSKYDKNFEQNESCKKQSQERYSSSEESDVAQKRIDRCNRIRSSVHKREKKLRNDSSNYEQNDSDTSDNFQDLRAGLFKNKSRRYEAEKYKKKSYEKQNLDRYSNDTVGRTNKDRYKSDRIRSSVHKIENQSRNKINDREQDNRDFGDDYLNDLRTDASKSKQRSEKEIEGWSNEYYGDYSNKRKRNPSSENKRHNASTERKKEQMYENQDSISHFQENSGEKFKSKAPSDSTDAVIDSTEPLSKRQKIVNINMRTGGAYIPPARLRMMQESIKDKGSEEYQRIAWEALKKSIIGMTNKVNSSNITEIIPELFKENIIRGRGVLARAIMQAQAASPTFTRVYAALVAIINTKFPEIGELILKRLIIQYKRGFRRNDKIICMTAARFLAHLLNQEVAHEVLILEMVTHLLENPTEDSVEIAIGTLKECGKKLTQLTPKGMRAITERVRNVLHEASIDMRVRYMIEVFFAVQKDGFKDFEVIPPELDLIEEDDKYTHLINLDEAVDVQDMLNIFKFDPDYLENEEKYKSVVNEILGDSSDESGNESDDESEEDEEKEKDDGSDQKILDMTETNLVCLRRKIYLTIQSSLDFEECAHKLLKLELKPGQILEMCYMILDCCAQQRTYEKFYGLLAQRFCQLNKIYVEPFTEIFDNSYKTIHRLETNKLRNVAKFFAHLLYTDAISWNVLSIIKLNEDDTTSSSRIFIKILFQELCEYMGLPKLNERVKDVTLQEAFEGLFPRDHPHNTRFAINFFTSIGLGGLTDELREHLKNLPKNPAPLVPDIAALSQSSSDSSSSSSSTSSSSSSSSSSSDSDSDSQKNASSKRKVTQKRRK